MKKLLRPLWIPVFTFGLIVPIFFTFKVFFKNPTRIPPLRTIQDPGCRRTYENFYKNNLIDIRVVFGYKDARPARFVADRYERMNLIQVLLKSCTLGESACGFERSNEDADLFQKQVFGPDGKLKSILLRVTHSSVGPDDDENRGDPFQKWQSQHAKKTFTEGLKIADALFYNGHSRAGGGPDFEPARLRADLHVAYDWYKTNQPGLNEMSQTLATPSSLKLLGLFSCASNRLFSDKLSQLKQQMGLITSEKLLYFADAQENLIDTLSALIEMKCQPEFNIMIHRRWIQAGSQLTGFFKD